LHDFERGAVDRFDLVARPGLEQLDRVAHIAMSSPIRIEGRGFVGDADIFGKRGHYRIVPDLARKGFEFCAVHGVVLLAERYDRR